MFFSYFVGVLGGIDSSYLQWYIKSQVFSVNGSYALCQKFLSFSPFSGDFTIVDNCVDLVQGTALTLVSLFFVIDFFSKTINLEWVKWENVIMLFAKLFVSKAIIDNAPALMTVVYDVFSGIQQTLNSTLVSEYAFEYNGVSFTGNSLLPMANMDVKVDVSDPAWAQLCDMFLGGSAQWQGYLDDDMNLLGMKSFVSVMQLTPTFLILQLVMIVCQVTVLGRVFELMVYTIIAPLPLSTFTITAVSDVGKTFVKSYVAVCLQASMLIIMFAAFSQLQTPIQNFVSTMPGYGSTLSILLAAVLGLGCIKSGSWANKICGLGG